MIKFYGYKRCSTSKKAQKWLDDHHIAYEYQDLVEKPPKQEDLLKWLNKFQDRGLRYFFNTSGQVYRQMHSGNLHPYGSPLHLPVQTVPPEP